MTYRILAMDGGPQIATELRVMMKLEDAYPGFLARTEQFVGSSAGSMVSLYLARRMSAGDPAPQVLRDALAFTEGIFELYSPSDGEELQSALSNALVGGSAMLGNRGIEAFLNRELGESTRLGDLQIRAACLTTSVGPPDYSPRLWSNFGPEATPQRTLVEAAMTSGAFPLWVPARDGLVDGCMFNNSPGMPGLAAAIGAETSKAGRARMLETASLLQLGTLDGGSSLSNRYLPGTPSPALPDAAVRKPTVTITDATTEADLKAVSDYGLYWAGAFHDSLQSQLSNGIPLPEPPSRVRNVGARVKGVIEAAADGLYALTEPIRRKDQSEIEKRKLATDDDHPRNQSWGWREWLGYPVNPAYILQQWLNSLGRGADMTARHMIGERALRVGPTTYMGTNVYELGVIFGVLEPVYWFSEFSVELWANPVTSQRFEFAPDWQTTTDWVERFWMRD